MPFKHDPDGDGPVQPGLPGILQEEAPLPSEVVISGGVLARRQREALSQIRGLLLERPEDVSPEEWRVVTARLAPPSGHLGRATGTAAGRWSLIQAARECFPGLSPTAAVKRFREVEQRPAVRKALADIRALELADLFEQRGMCREALHASIAAAGLLYDADLLANPDQWAKVSACVTAATKVLVDMDGLRARPEDAQPTTDAPDDSADVGATLRAKAERVMADLRARKTEPAGA